MVRTTAPHNVRLFSDQYCLLVNLSKDERAERVQTEYKKLWVGIDKNDAEAVNTVMEPYLTELARLDAEAAQGPEDKGKRSPFVIIKNCREHMNRTVCLSLFSLHVNSADIMQPQARAFCNINDVHIGGFIVYAGSDPASRTLSAVFSGSNEVAELATINHDAIRDTLLDYIETKIKFVILLPNPAGFCGLLTA